MDYSMTEPTRTKSSCTKTSRVWYNTPDCKDITAGIVQW